MVVRSTTQQAWFVMNKNSVVAAILDDYWNGVPWPDTLVRLNAVTIYADEPTYEDPVNTAPDTLFALQAAADLGVITQEQYRQVLAARTVR